jgi:uncharacterized protein
MSAEHHTRSSVARALLLLLGLMAVGVMFTSVMGVLLGQLLGWDMNQLGAGRLTDEASPALCWQFRALALLSQIGVFLLPGFLLAPMFGRLLPSLQTGVALNRWPNWGMIGLGCLLLLGVMPLEGALFEWNKSLLWSESMREAAEAANTTIRNMLQMPDWGNYLFCLFLFAVVPAFGEELVFRGIVQTQLMRLLSPWVAILLTGGIFSFIHLQFDGFFARWLAGVVLGFLFWRSGNLWVVIAVHFLHNALQVTAQFLFQQQVTTTDLDQVTHVPILLALGSALVTVALARLIIRHSSVA